MITTIRSTNLWVMTLVLGSFWLFAPFMNRAILFDLMNGLCISACTGVILIYYPSVAKRLGSWRWFMFNRLSGPHYFVLAMTGTMLYTIYRCAWNWVWRLICPIDDFQNSLALAFSLWFMTFVACTFLLARDIDEGHIPTANWWWVGMCTGVGLAMAFTVMAFVEPDAPRWLLNLVLPVYPCRL